jgi:hypothetical protein
VLSFVAVKGVVRQSSFLLLLLQRTQKRVIWVDKRS